MIKNIFAFTICALSLTVNAQIKTPAPSPAATVKQTVGLTDLEIVYSRPSKKDRVIFGDLVPFDAVWRTGANKNTTITTDDMMIFGKDTLQAGTYAIFTNPGKEAWKIMFYTDSENWGTPGPWDEEKVALSVSAKSQSKADVTESFTISIDNVTSNGAILSISWDKTSVSIPFGVATKTRVMSKIDAVMAGPSAGDYYAAANYYYSEKKELKTALMWIDKAITLRDDNPYWIIRKKSLIQAELGDYAGAIETAKVSLKAAQEKENNDYIKMNNDSIAEWSKKVK
ncbi:MAG: hypothetical protein ACI837_001963 [Crocinitomicaceae bacterium]|jgi:hypothetical protein